MKRKNLIMLLLIAIIGIVGVTIAYFSSQATFENVFETPEYGTEYIEKFTSPDNWKPGDVTEKTLEVKNNGTVDEAVRVKVEESWVSNRGTKLPLTQGDNVAALINFINEDDWTKVTVDGEDYYYYYYNYKLAPEETTSKLLDKVTFNPLINATISCTETVEDGVLTRTCNSSGDGYDGATYTLKFAIETVQYNKYQDAWNTSINIALTKEIIVYGLHVNPKSATYETGDKHQMFMFNHEATAQTPALIDYRYIGKDPYNYVYFNCDDLDNQNEETCEVWRILGVFDVQREVDDEENPGQKKTITEQRMKLVRGQSSTNMRWNNVRSNDWTNASLMSYLNNSYYNGLKEASKLMIEEAKYYLGSSNGIRGTTEQIYKYERGNVVCKDCNNDVNKLTWLGKIALMYASDQYMVYSKNVNDACYTFPAGCRDENAGTGWVRNSNRSLDYLQNSSRLYTWFLTTSADTQGIAFYEDVSGNLFYNYYVDVYSYNVRPTLYLSSDVQIVNGDGSEGNPYKLQKIQ